MCIHIYMRVCVNEFFMEYSKMIALVYNTVHLLFFWQGKYHVIENLLGRFHNLPVAKRGPAEKTFLETLEAAKSEARSRMRRMFNPYFGSPFLTSSGKESAFAYNVQRYADVYTSRLDNFLRLSHDSWIYTPADVKILPHHVKVGAEWGGMKLEVKHK